MNDHNGRDDGDCRGHCHNSNDDVPASVLQAGCLRRGDERHTDHNNQECTTETFLRHLSPLCSNWRTMLLGNVLALLDRIGFKTSRPRWILRWSRLLVGTISL